MFSMQTYLLTPKKMLRPRPGKGGFNSFLSVQLTPSRLVFSVTSR